MNKEIKSFLGTGWSFPPSFGLKSRSVQMVSEEEDIKQSIYLLLSTIPGERIMKPKYGCDLHALVFERLSSTTKSRIHNLISSAVLKFEPRIKVEEILIEMSSNDYGLIEIKLIYTIKKTNSRDNIVYPFYFKEGTNIRNM